MDRLKMRAAPLGGGLSSLTSRTDWMANLRPDLPSNALPEAGCLLLHRIDRSYGASQTQRLWRSLPLSLVSVTPNDLRRRTYLNIHSPTMVCAMASTTVGVWLSPFCDAAPASVVPVLAVVVEGCDRWWPRYRADEYPSRVRVMSLLGKGGSPGLSGALFDEEMEKGGGDLLFLRRFLWFRG